MQEEECSCCDECHYSQFVKQAWRETISLMVPAEMAPDPQVPLHHQEYSITYDSLKMLCQPDPGPGASDDSD